MVPQMKYLLFIIILNESCWPVYGSLNDYINDVKKYLGFPGQENSEENFIQNIPYEVSTVEEKFISEAAKLTGIELSELDSCQQRVILKLKIDCNKLNDEQLAKLAVHLLNCQSYIEGRPTFPCTEDMGIKDCTSKMDSDTWMIYHLMSNRARAVCYMIRQSQFRGLAENTVNKLMDATKHQIRTLNKISVNQENIQNMAHETYDSIAQGHSILSQQQKDIQTAQFHGQLVIEQNIARLVDEKRLIAETHNKLMLLTKDLQQKLEESYSQLNVQNSENKLNHQELLRDLVAIQEQAREIFKKIEESSQLLLQNSKEFNNQYECTLKNLMEINKTVHTLVSLVGGTKKALEERLEWVSTALGGTDLTVERLYLIIWHVAFLLFGMLGCAFLDTRTCSRVVVTLLPCVNLVGGLCEENQHLNPIQLMATIATLILVHTLIDWITNYRKVHSIPGQKLKQYDTPKKNSSADTEVSLNGHPYLNPDTDFKISSSDTYGCEFGSSFEEKGNSEFNEFGTPTPPMSRNGFYTSRSRSKTPNLFAGKESCHAKTRLGTPCKLSCLSGRDFCYRHQSGNSVAGK